jgi:hypothetical protein
MIARSFNSLKDYVDVCSWWDQQKCQIIPVDMLSTTGFIIEHDDNKLLAGWMYHTNSSIGFLEFAVGNPNFKGEIRDIAFDIFFDTVFKYSKLHGIKNIISTTSHPKMPKRLIDVGFIKINDNVTNFMRSI